MMTFKFATRRASLLTCVLAFAALSPSVAHAGTIYAWVVADPVTTAGAGIAPIPGGGANMVVSSSRSGPGTFHVYALDDATGSAGLRSFFIKLNGTVSGVLNRSPNGTWDNAPVFGDGTASTVGFDGARTTTPLLGASQSPTNAPQIAGIGISAGNLQAATGAGSWIANPTSGQWGAVGSFLNFTGHVRSPVFLGEGFYTGAPPTVDITTSFASGGTGFNFWSANGFPNSGSSTAAVGTTETLSNEPACLDCEPHNVGLNFNNVNANAPGLLSQAVASNGTPAMFWGGFAFVSGPTPAVPPTFDPATHQFSWNTTGSPIGTYQWSVRAGNPFGTSTGFVTVNITSVPEPATLSLLGLAMVAGLGVVRRRRA